MPSRVVTHRSRLDYAAALGFDMSEPHRWVGGDLIPSYNGAPGKTGVILHRLHTGREQSDVIRWGYQSPDRLTAPPTTSIPAEVAPELRFFRHMWAAARAILPIDGWFEWTHQDGQRLPWYVKLRTDEPMFVAILTNFQPYRPTREGTGFVLIESPDARGAINLDERRPLVLMPADARRWIDPATLPEEAETIALTRGRILRHFSYHRVSLDVNDSSINAPYLIDPI